MPVEDEYTSSDPIIQAELDKMRGAVTSFQEAAIGDEPKIQPPGNGTIKLLYGLELNGERRDYAEVRELNGGDEEALARLDVNATNYPVLVVDTVIGRAVTSIGGVDVKRDQLQNLLMGDREVLFKEILFATYGTTKDYDELICPDCKEAMDLHVDIEALLETVPLAGDEPTTKVTLRDGRVVQLHYPTGKDQMFVYSSDKALTEPEINTLMLQRCIDTVDGYRPTNLHEFAVNLGIQDRRNLIAALAEGPSVRFKEVEVPCEHCGKELPFVVGWADLLQL